VKSVWEHASLGIDDDSIVGAAAVPGLLERRRAVHGGRWLAEAFVPGRELNVALIASAGGVRVLPPAEIRFDAFPPGKARIVGYAAKWQAASFEYAHTPRSFDVEPALAKALETTARACWQAFELEGYARVDFRVDAAGKAWVLEVNTNPCLSPDAGFAAALDTAGIPFAEAVSWLIEDALRRAAL
jgi:D-alanine-D-alanine ligase